MIIIKNGALVTPEGLRRADLAMDGDKIVRIAVAIEPGEGDTVQDATDCWVFPGFIDGHTHMQCWTGMDWTADSFETGTRAAACGGTTTIVDYATADRGWKGCLCLPGDQPLVSPDSFKALAGAFKAGGGVAPVRLSLNGEPASPVLFPASLFPDLMGLKGRDGGSSLLRGRADVQLVEARAYELWDVDTAKGQRRVSEHVAACSYFDRVADFIQN